MRDGMKCACGNRHYLSDTRPAGSWFNLEHQPRRYTADGLTLTYATRQSALEALYQNHESRTNDTTRNLMG